MSSEFVLRGHDCPLGSYPAPVVPIGEMDGKLYALYWNSGKTTPVEVPPGAQFIVHDLDTQQSLKGFSRENGRLFAYGASHLVVYSAGEERDFFKRVLKDALFSLDNPFLRLSLAKTTAEFDVVLPELAACASFLDASAPDFTATWYQNELKSCAESGLESGRFPADVRDVMAGVGATSRARGEVAQLLRSVGGFNVVTSPEMPFDLYFEQSGRGGRCVRAAVEIRGRERIDENHILDLLSSRSSYLDQSIVDEIWLVGTGEVTKAAAKLGESRKVYFRDLTELSKQSASMNAFEFLFIDAANATVRLRPWLQFHPRSSHDFVRLFPAVEDDPLSGLTLFASEYIGEILSAAEHPSRCILTFDLTGAQSDFPDWTLNPLFRSRVLANASYASAFRQRFPGRAAGALRVLLIDPRQSLDGRKHLGTFLRLHLDRGVAVSVILHEGRATSLGKTLVSIAGRYQRLLPRMNRLSSEIHKHSSVHSLMCETARMAGTILHNPNTSFLIKNEGDIETMLRTLTQHD